MTRKMVSIICPVHNEEAAIPIFYNRLVSTLAKLNGAFDFEIIFTDNCSTDNSFVLLSDLRKEDPRVQILSLSRNFGYQASIQAGITFARGHAMVMIDVDCEDPPEMIPMFLSKWGEGYDVVCGIRKDRVENWFLKKTRNLFYRILKLMSDMEIVLYMAEFVLIADYVRDQIVNNRNTYPFLRAEIGYVGYQRFGIEYARQSRVAGKTHYNYLRMISFAVGGILSASTFLLRVPAYIFPLMFVLTLGCLSFSHYNQSNKFFAVTVLLHLFFIYFFVAVICLYIARIYKNGIGRPVYIINRKRSLLNSEVLNRFGSESRL